ncbi:Similar to Vacuolar protein sorting-associated protein 41 homolog; acc. no. Q5KU39 [Pyronema omphalodes CBS 100304]|uniref:Similar to Vacuolar protein sorting-associated protein 41 homolog acc. no. Q5KU39 n=1 Tax=Pyronema omphalodes (strain CBS 100304) TaxID=1076935 RepID=U4L5E6_PYROM|nr:Similar to Vacuolar protein sorting-associated protein 41 homolog; acc. no. Q5KU39 [Pyronema omphalodes CBS 100304]
MPPPHDNDHDDHADEEPTDNASVVDSGDEEEEEEEEDDEEPRLKYTRLTKSLGGVYRNGDAVSTTVVFGDRMHILSLPSLTPLRTYHAHSASVTSISISPPPPPPVAIPTKRHKDAYHDRHISVASASIDGLVCTVPLLPSTPPAPGQSLSTVPYAKSEITLKNFKRPILAVALSPNFRADRTFLSGGLAGNLVLSVAPTGGVAGGSWMTLGLSGGAKDTILHSGEGAISAIAWSKESPRYVAWANEQGIKIMRSHITPPTLQAQTQAQTQGPAATTEEITGNPGLIGWIPGFGSGPISGNETAWKRISAIERPENIPEELASLHKPRLEWIDRRALLTSDPDDAATGTTLNVKDVDWGDKEKLLVGWGGTVWVIDVFPGSGEPGEENSNGWAQITHILQTDCTISGLYMYTPSLILMLAYLTNTEAPTEEEVETPPTSPTSPRSPRASPRFRRGRTNALIPELRFIDLETSEEVSADELMMSRFESLAVGDYHLGILPATPTSVHPPTPDNEQAEGGLGASLWTAALAPTQLFNSGAQSIRSFGTGSRRDSIAASGFSSATAALRGARAKEVTWGEDEKGTKIYITSPYDVVFATERSQKDHLSWMLDRKKYADAWHLIDKHPEVVDPDTTSLSMYDEEERKVIVHLDDDYDSDSTVTSSVRQRSVKRYTVAEKEKRRIGELWLRDLIDAGEWKRAGEVCGQVLGLSSRWEYWVWVFEAAKKIEEITNYIPTTQLSPPLPSVIYEIVLAYYLNHDRRRFRELLLEIWKPEGSHTLYDARTLVDTIILKIENREDEIHKGDTDWRLLQECLARLYMVLREPRNALRRYMILKDADEAFRLIRDYRLVDTVKDDIASLIMLRVTDKQLAIAPIKELEKATYEAISLLINESDRGILSPKQVVEQLSSDKIVAGRLFLYFYLRRLWKNQHDQMFTTTGGALAEFEDLMVELFAEYDRPLLMEFLKDSHNYSLEKASAVCERRNYIPELVHLLSKTGQTKRALFLIIDKLADVTQAISFAKQQDDPDLWNDLLDYSMDKPKFIRGLLENVGTAIDPITLVRRIPAGLQIEGLKEALAKILKEYAVQWSICDGVAKAMTSEVARGMESLRHGQRRGVKFQVGEIAPLPVTPDNIEIALERAMETERVNSANPNEVCGICEKRFSGHNGKQRTLVAFACGHVFHLHCISRPVTAADEEDDEHEEEIVQSGYGRSVGAKVTRAALLGEKVKKGCSVCAKRKREEIMV